ncbi:MAG TPA: SPFH domain-containing protein [Sedimentisphaerales bacterium]|nr:SPFH domain-containing protein [Sedimentisphaerales bacterium]
MTISSKRAERLSFLAFVLSVIFSVGAYLVGKWSGSFAIYSLSWLLLSSVFIWLILIIQFHQRSLAEQEKLDMDQLAKTDDSSTIFQAKTEQSTLFAVAQKRLSLFEKWFLPIFSSLAAIYQILAGIYLFKSVKASIEGVEVKDPLRCALAMTVIAFVSFLISRYATGMSAEKKWKPLRGGGSFILGIAILCFILAISFTLLQFKILYPVMVMNWVLPIVLVILGAENGLNIVMDIYRPRIADQYSRSGFDSRLLGIINEPGNVFHTAAGALDYQFGFKVSQTWFYKLLAKAVIPLFLTGALVLYLLSCIVVINPDEQAVVEHFGNPLTADGGKRIVGPGVLFKWPWPIDIAYKHPVKKIMELPVGYVPKIDPKTGDLQRGALLWGKQHYEEEYSLLVASKQAATSDAGAAVPVSLVKANIPLQYKVKDIYAYLYNHNEPEKVLESICYSELAKFAASATIEVDDENEMTRSLLGAGRADAKDILTERIQKACDNEDLGIDVLFVGLQGVHPPVEVASDYQKVVGAVQLKEAIILTAEKERTETLINLVGSVKEADELSRLAEKYQKVESSGSDPAEVETLGKQIDAQFTQAKGEIFAALRESQSYAFERTAIAKATGERFAGQLQAYNASKDIYRKWQRLNVFEEALYGVRKYIVVADSEDQQVFIVDMQEKLTTDLYDVGGFEEPK